MTTVQTNPFRKNGSLKQKNRYTSDMRVITGYGCAVKRVVKPSGFQWKFEDKPNFITHNLTV